MSVVEEKVTFGDKLHIWFTKARVPLMAIAILALVAGMKDIKFFWIGTAICVLGELIQMWATSHLHKDMRLTISGPYSHVRNPMYFGRFFVGLGLMTMTANPYIVGLYIIAYVVYVQARVGREEKRLIGIFSADYEHYLSEIHRFMPRLKPYSKSENRRASWKQMCKNHEQIVAAGVVIVLALIYCREVFVAWHWPG